MTSGIKVDPDCSVKWNEMKIQHRFKYISFKVKDDEVIIVDQTSKPENTFEDFQKLFPSQDCRYAVVEVPDTNKIVFIMWTPDSAPTKQKMIYATTRTAIVQKLDGHAKTIQANDLSQLQADKLKKFFNM